MIFARRAIQTRLHELRPIIGDTAADRIANRLNIPGADRMAAMWEVAIAHALTRCGAVRHEVPLPSGKQPDIEFEGDGLRFTADVTCVSDEGLDDNNPYWELSEEIRKAIVRMGMPGGGVNLSVQSTRTVTRRGVKTTLKLPDRRRLHAFVQNRIMPELRRQRVAGERVLRVTISDDDADIDLTIDTVNTRYSTGYFAAYDEPNIKDRNPLYDGLERKVDQLRAATGLTGVVVGDGDCQAMAIKRLGRDTFSAEQIVREFFRQHSTIDFVLLITVVEKDRSPLKPGSKDRKLQGRLLVRDGDYPRQELDDLFIRMMSHLPKPVMMPVNGALRAREKEYESGNHGSWILSGSKITVGLREMTEVLAGLRTFADDGAKNIEAARRLPRHGMRNRVEPTIQHKLLEGRLPIAMRIIKGGDDDNDDLVEIEFGDPDAAIAPIL